MLIDPYGRAVTSQKREIATTNPHIARFASMADVPFQQLRLTVVCQDCGRTPHMANASTDDNWKMECDCTVRVLKNPGRPQ